MKLDQRYRFFFLFFLRIICMAATMFASFTATAQKYYSRNFTVEDGLPSNIVRAVFKDSRGIMWIGTGAGLCRFNGREFKVYNSADGLAAENIFDITEDDKGNLWIGAMGGGISMFDGKKFRNYSEKNGLISKEVRRVWWSNTFKTLLIGTNKGVCAFNGDKFYSLSAAMIHSSNDTYIVLCFLEYKDYIDLYSYGSPAVYRYYPATHEFKQGFSDRQTNPCCALVYCPNGDTVWSWGRNGIRVYNKTLRQSFDSLGQPFHMTADDEHRIWIAAWAETPSGPVMPGGLYVYDGKTVVRMSEKIGISDPGVWTVFYDSVFHVIWVGTLHQGLFRIPSPCFEWYPPSFFGLSSMKVSDIHFDKQDNLWIATSHEILRKNRDGTVVRYPNRLIREAQYESFRKNHPLFAAQQIDKNGSFGKYQQLRAEGKFPYPNPYHTFSIEYQIEQIVKPGSFYAPQYYRHSENLMRNYDEDTSAICFFAIGEDSRNSIYVSGGFGLNRFDVAARSAKPEIIPIVNENIWVFAFDDTDTLYGSSYWDNGIWHCAVNPELKYPDHHYYFTDRDKAPRSPVRMISRGNEIWCASKVGGIYLTIDGRCYAFCKNDSSLPRSINDICFDGPKNLIAGSNGGEVLILKPEGEKLKVLFRLGRKQGIIGKSIQFVQTDLDGNLFIGTNEGLNLIDLQQMYVTGKPEIQFFSHETGYSNLNAKRAVVDKDGNVCIAFENSVCVIKRGLLKKNPAHKMKLTLTGMEVNNSPLSAYDSCKMDAWFEFPEQPVRLSHDENNLGFYFDALNYLDPGQQRFRYRLLPEIKNWSDYSAKREAYFTTLGPGHYTLEVETCNTLDQTQVSSLSYSFRILPPFYLRWWFILVVFAVVCSLITLAFIIRSRQIRKEEKHKADLRIELNNIEMKALKAQMNPHFIFNAINSIQSYILSSNVDKALFYLSMFAKLVRKTLENASKEFIPVVEELEYLNYYVELEKMRFEGQFTAEIDIEPDFPLETTMIPPMIIQPFIENAIKHGLLQLYGVATLQVMVKKLNDFQYQVIIEDNGIGRKRAEQIKKSENGKHVSKGMEITNTRMRLLNDNGVTGMYKISIIDLCNPDGSARGTRVEVTFPMDI